MFGASLKMSVSEVKAFSFFAFTLALPIQILAKPQEEEKEAALEVGCLYFPSKLILLFQGLFASWVQEGNLASLEAMFSEGFAFCLLPSLVSSMYPSSCSLLAAFSLKFVRESGLQEKGLTF